MIKQTKRKKERKKERKKLISEQEHAVISRKRYLFIINFRSGLGDVQYFN